MDIIVVGIGGNSQTNFMNYLHEKSFRLNHNRDGDGLKHKSCPSKLSFQQKNVKLYMCIIKLFTRSVVIIEETGQLYK